MKISWILMMPAGSEAGSNIRQDVRTGETIMSNLPRKINIFNFETCSGPTWLSSSLPLSISSTVHSSFLKVFNPFIFSFLRTSAWPLMVPLWRWSRQSKAFSLLRTKSSCHHFLSEIVQTHLKQVSTHYHLKLLVKNLRLKRPSEKFQPQLAFILFLDT